MRIFIGSSRKGLNLVREIEVWLEGVGGVEGGLKTLPWDTPGLFEPGAQTLQSLLEIARGVDAAIFLFGEDDKVWYRNDSVARPRDNVLIEYGLFVGILGMKKAIICTNGTPKLAVDVHGLAHVDLSEKVRSRGRYDLLKWAEKITTGKDIPELDRIRNRVREVERGNATLIDEVGALKGIVEDLKTLLTAKEQVDFDHYDLAADGHWKLLFDIEYFKSAAQGLTELVDEPSKFQMMLINGGASEIADRIAWNLPDHANLRNVNPQMSGWFANKILRLFRDHSEKELFLRFIRNAPVQMKKVFDDRAKRAIEIGRFATTQ